MRKLLWILVLFSACEAPTVPLTEELLKGKWIGTYVEIDPEVRRPFCEFMEIKPDLTVQYLGSRWRKPPMELNLTRDSLVTELRSFHRNEIMLKSKDELTFSKNYPFHYRRIDANVIEMDSSAIKDVLRFNSWRSDEEIWHFTSDSLVRIDLKTNTKHQTCWDIYDFEGYKFVKLEGNFMTCDYPLYSFLSIDSITSLDLKLTGWSNDSFGKKRYKRIDPIDLDFYAEPAFRLCNPFIYENMRSDWYHFKYTEYKGGLYALRKRFEQGYVPVHSGRNNGTVKVQFIVNCVGEIGKFEVEEWDENYKPMKLEPKIRLQILDILKGSGNWIPGQSRDVFVDTYKYLIFKIKDGEVTEIFP